MLASPRPPPCSTPLRPRYRGAPALPPARQWQGALGPGVPSWPGWNWTGGSGLTGRSVLFICCFNLSSSFTSLFREGAAAASSCRPCVRLSVRVLGRVGLGPRCPEDRALGRLGGWWIRHWQATVNFKEFLQDIFINFFLGCFWKRAWGRGAAGWGRAVWFLLSVPSLHTHTHLNSGAVLPSAHASGWAPLPRALGQAWLGTLVVLGPRAGQGEGPELAPPTHRMAGAPQGFLLK